MTKKTRLCGTVLNDHPDVLKQSKVYPLSINYNSKKTPPESFNGGEAWANLITNTLLFKPYSGDWAYASTYAVNLRVNIYAFLNFYVSDFSKTDPMLFIDKPPRNGSESSLFRGQEKSIFNGYSIYDALEFCFINGFISRNCANYSDYIENGIDIDKIEKGSFKEKMKIIKENTSTNPEEPKILDRTHCLSKIDNKYIARRIYRVIGITNLGLVNDPIEKVILSIKREIYTSGPVICGMLIYDNFIDSTGIDIYTGPLKDSKIIGGHAMVIMGWGKDPKHGDYWLINSCWNDFGELGITRIKCGIKKCLLERNSVGFIPEIPNAVLYAANENITYTSPYLNVRIPLDNPLTFYSPQTRLLLNLGILVNEYGNSKIIPLIRNINNLPPLENYIASDIEYYYDKNFVENQTETSDKVYNIIMFLSSLILFVIFYNIFKSKSLKIT
jgi:hypothetical protein